MKGIALPDIKPLKATIIKIVKSGDSACIGTLVQRTKESPDRPKTFKMLVLDKDGIVYQRKGGLYSK